MYLMGACAVLGMSNKGELSEDLESDPFLNSTVQRFTCSLYYPFGSFIIPLNIGIITSIHYLLEHGIKTGRTNGDDRHDMTDMTRKQPATLSKYIGLGAAMAAEIMIGFWFDIGVILAVGIVDYLNYCIEEVMTDK